eukprot:gene10856-12646_t
MVKSYLKFVQEDVFGVISTSTSLFDKDAKMCVTGCGERVTVWNLKQSKLERSLFEEDSTSEVTTLALSRDATLLAAGHADGTIRLWSMRDFALVSVFNGHRGAVTTLHFGTLGATLVSGSRDTEVIVWDVITEAGLFRLRGHRDAITCVRLLERTNHLVTASKDGLIKIWDVETQHCIQTIVGHRNPIWAIDVNADETRLVSVTSDSNIRCWRIARNEAPLPEGYTNSINIPINNVITSTDADAKDDGEMKIEDTDDVTEEEFATYYGSIPCKGESYSGIRFDPTNRILIAQSTGKFFDLFAISHSTNLLAKVKKDRNRKDINVIDEYYHTETVKTPSKIRGFSFGNAAHWNKYIVSLYGNSIQSYEIKEEGSEATNTLDSAGHRSDVRSIVLSSNDTILASTSSDSVKIWNVKTMNCIRSFACDYGLCSVFVPGNLHVVVGTKSGTLELFELSSAEHLGSIQAHSGAIWALTMTPDLRGIVSGGADKLVKFWDFELTANKENPKIKTLTLSHSQTLTLESDVMSVKFSKDNRYLAVSLLDNTVKIFFSNTLKFHISLYGHKLPVMCMDISDDSTLIATGSADKNIKIWGLDYGDCHKSIFAHDDSIMQVAFIPKTHYFISTSKDKRIKYWDGDKFEQIQTIEAHHGEVWALAMGSVGDFFITGSHDRSIRIFKQTQEPIFVDSEKQMALDKEWESSLESDNRMRTTEMLEEHASANKKTLETIIAGEEILDALTLAEDERLKIEDYERELTEDRKKGGNRQDVAFAPNILLFGMSHEDYLWSRVAKVRASDLEEALLVLPFGVIKPLFNYFVDWLEAGKNVELISKCVFFLVQTHQSQLSTTVDMVPLLKRLNGSIKERLQRERNIIGFNRSAMSYLRREIETSRSFTFFADAVDLVEADRKGKSKGVTVAKKKEEEVVKSSKKDKKRSRK